MGRRLLEQRTKIDPERRYSPREALELIKSLEGAKFDESVEAHVHLSVDPRRADQMVRGTLMLPNGTGKTRRVAVFAEGEKAREAEEAGADVVGSADLASRIKDQGFMDFDVAVATPDQQRAGRQAGAGRGPRAPGPPAAGTRPPWAAAWRSPRPTRCARSGSWGGCSARGGSCRTRRAGPLRWTWVVRSRRSSAARSSTAWTGTGSSTASSARSPLTWTASSRTTSPCARSCSGPVPRRSRAATSRPLPLRRRW